MSIQRIQSQCEEEGRSSSKKIGRSREIMSKLEGGSQLGGSAQLSLLPSAPPYWYWKPTLLSRPRKKSQVSVNPVLG